MKSLFLSIRKKAITVVLTKIPFKYNFSEAIQNAEKRDRDMKSSKRDDVYNSNELQSLCRGLHKMVAGIENCIFET